MFKADIDDERSLNPHNHLFSVSVPERNVGCFSYCLNRFHHVLSVKSLSSPFRYCSLLPLFLSFHHNIKVPIL